MFADKSMQGLTFLLSGFLRQVGKIERPYPVLCLQMVRLVLLFDGARLQMGSPEAGWSKLLLSGPSPATLTQKETGEPAGAGRPVYVQFHVPIPSWATP